MAVGLDYQYIAIIILGAVWGLASYFWNKKHKSSSTIKIYPFILIVSSRRLKSLIERIGTKWSGAWRRLGKIADVLFPSLIVVAGLYLVFNLYFLINGRSLVIGGIPVGASFIIIVPVVTVPLNAMLLIIGLAILIAVIPHEILHGIVASSEGMKIKNAGFIISIGLAGGYVELEDEELIEKIFESIEQGRPIESALGFIGRDRSFENKGTEIDNSTKTHNTSIDMSGLLRKLRRVYAVGLLANIILLGIFMGANYSAAATGFLEEYGVKIVGLDPSGNAKKYDLRVGDIIININNTRIKTISEFLSFMGQTHPGDLIIVRVDRGDFLLEIPVIVGEKNGRPYLGVVIQQYIKSSISALSGELALHIYYFLRINVMIEFIIIIFNAAPIFIVDGAGWIKTFFVERYGKKGLKYFLLLNVIFSIIVFANLLYPWVAHP